MTIRMTLVLAAAAVAFLPPIASATPPDHAPAHGWRAKHRQVHKHHHERTRAPEPRHNGIEVVYDSERGVHVAVGFPDIFFEAGHYYRVRDGHWEVSVSGRDGWSVSAKGEIPGTIVEARRKKSHPGPAAKAPRDDDDDDRDARHGRR